MAETVTMPKLGFDMAEGTLVRWVKVEGDNVQKGEVLAEIETDKATVEVESSFSGVVARHLVAQGDIVPVGTPIAVVAQPGESIEAAPSEGKETKAAAAPEAPKAADAVSQPAAAEQSGQQESPNQEGGRLKVSPLARRVAQEQGVDLYQVKGSGPDGRIVRSDVEAAAKLAAAAPVPAAAAAPSPAVPAAAPAAKPAVAPLAPVPMWTGQTMPRKDEVVKVNRLRATIGRRMVESKQQVPHIYVTRVFNVEKLMDLRKQLNAYLPDDQKLTVNDFIIKAVALSLYQFPNINASLRGDEIVRHGQVNVGSAVSIDGGLMTVVVKDADQKPLRVISSEMREMVTRARLGKVKTEDIEGSTFSISNMGMYEVEHFVAIINPPEAAILAVGSALEQPVVVDGQVKVGLRMRATISSDHRITDGAETARFMQALAAYLEDPMRLML